MCSTPLNKGFLPTSTPISPLRDSGYFSSCDKLPLDKVLHTLSPIKEISNFKRVTDLVEFTRFQVFESPCVHFDEKHFDPNAVARELNFSNSADFLGDSFNDYTCDFEDEENAFQNYFPSFQIQDLSGEQDKTIFQKKFLDSDRQCYGINFHHNIKLVNVYNRLNLSHVNKTASSLDGDCNKVQFVNFKTAFKLRNKVDFLEEFEKKNLYSVTSLLLSLLSAEDLCRVSCVNKNWSETVQSDVHANCRRKVFLKQKYSQKENQYYSSTSSEIKLEEKYSPHDGGCKTVLFNKCNFAATSKQPLKKQAITKFDSFVKEGKTLVNSILMKCPKCKYAAKSQIGNAYLCTECNYAFCQRCLGPYLKSHACSTSKKVSMVIGSKQSKRNLKRL